MNINHFSTPLSQAIILFAHGSSQSTWRAPFDDIAVRVQTLLAQSGQNTLVQLAFLELMAPSIAQATHDLAKKGVRDIHIVPLFFGVGKHIAQDLHGIVDDVRAQHPQVRIQIAAALGQSEFMRQAMAEYAFQALHDS
jgi:sirohydrochlorin cobaltochelatase